MSVRKAKHRLEKWRIKSCEAKGKQLSRATEEKCERHKPIRKNWKMK